MREKTEGERQAEEDEGSARKGDRENEDVWGKGGKRFIGGEK